MRRETYASTGPRMTVWFFGGWDFTQDDVGTREPGWIGYDKGVPMGSDLAEGPDGASPTFYIAALKDPIGGNLDRVQIIKGWVDEEGETHEKVYDVAWSDGRVPGGDGKLPPVGNTVDVENATWSNTIGHSGTDRRMGRPGFRSGTSGNLLRPSHPDPDTTLDGLRGATVPDRNAY